MSPNPGQPEHAELGWTHLICAMCWHRKNPDVEPLRLCAEFALETVEPCCYCGERTSSGIYIRENAAVVHGASVQA